MFKIDLQVSNLRKFQDLALLLDRPDVQKEIGKLFSTGKRKYKHEDLAWLLQSELRNYVVRILTRYKYPFGFTQALMAAGSRGKITDDNVRDCYVKTLVLPPDWGDEIPYPVPPNVITIFISPYNLDWKKKEIKKTVDNSINELATKITPLSKNHPLRRDIWPNIKRMRDCYWEKKIHKTPSKVLADRYQIDDINVIDKETSNYSKLLISEF